PCPPVVRYDVVGEVEGFGGDVCSQRRAQAADTRREEAYPFLLWGAGARVLALELLQRCRLLQASRVKALGAPVVDLCQQLVGCLPLALLWPQATVSRVASRPGVADAAGYRAWRRRPPQHCPCLAHFGARKSPFGYRFVLYLGGNPGKRGRGVTQNTTRNNAGALVPLHTAGGRGLTGLGGPAFLPT